MRAYTTEEWVILARGVHGEEYDYSKVDYKDTYTDVEVICPKPRHGSFFVQPKKHIGLREKGCPICKPSGRRVIDTSVFTEDAMAVHGDKYDYSKVEYQNNHTKCEIICPEPGHGSFSLSYRAHIRSKSGCPICEVISKAEKRSGTKQEIDVIDWEEEDPIRSVHETAPPDDAEERKGMEEEWGHFLEGKKMEGSLAEYNAAEYEWPDRGLAAVEDFEFACSSARTDPRGALAKCRLVAESYVQEVHAYHIGEPNDGAGLDEMISRLKAAGKIDKMEILELQELQYWGNLGAHPIRGRKPTYKKAKPIITRAGNLLEEWLDGFESSVYLNEMDKD